MATKTGTIKVAWHDYCVWGNRYENGDPGLILTATSQYLAGELRNAPSVWLLGPKPKFRARTPKVRRRNTAMFRRKGEFSLIEHYRVWRYVTSLLQLNGWRSSKHFVWLICPFHRLLLYGTVVIVAPGGVPNTWASDRKTERLLAKTQTIAVAWPTFWNQTTTRAFKLLTNIAPY